MAAKKKAAEPQGQTSPLFRDPPGIEHVPETRELAEQGLAKAVAYTEKGEPTHWRISPEGAALITAAMIRNAKVRRTAHAENPHAV